MGLFDAYKRGAEAAKSDGGENRLVSRALSEFAKNGFGMLPGAQNREDEFRRGYSETLETLVRDAQRNVPVHETGDTDFPASSIIQNTQGGSTMATNLNIQKSIDLLNEMGQFVREYKDAITEARTKFNSKIEGKIGSGMDQTVNDFYNVHVVPLSRHIKLGEDGLFNEALPSLWNVIQELEKLDLSIKTGGG